MADRAHLRSDYPVVVRVRCDRCARVVGTLYGDREQPVAFTAGDVTGVLPRGARVEYFRCRCGAEPLARYDRLVTVYRAKAGRPTKRERVIWLPTDLHGA